MKINRIDEFNACPLCGKRKTLWMTEYGAFHWFAKEYGYICSVVNMGCLDCNIMLSAYPEKKRNYQILVGELKKKWNRLGVKEGNVQRDQSREG